LARPSVLVGKRAFWKQPLEISTGNIAEGRGSRETVPFAAARSKT
jgi:hypothetical protein